MSGAMIIFAPKIPEQTIQMGVLFSKLIFLTKQFLT
jgi:hypothetical protein